MKTMNPLIVPVLVSFLFFYSGCQLDPIIAHGDVTGYVSDAETSLPLDSASIELNQSSVNIDGTSTDKDGNYTIRNIRPGTYELAASKPTYAKVTRDIEVKEEDPNINDFALNLAPYPEISVKYLDFGDESTAGSFTIRNIGSGTLSYSFFSAPDWITVYPTSGDATTETDTIKVTVNRSAISGETYKEIIRIISSGGEEEIRDTVHVYVNGVMGLEEEQYYSVVRIGTQVWMAENLNTGNRINFGPGFPEQSDNEEIEKYCYGNSPDNCAVYGGLYTWHEMMDYLPLENGILNETYLLYEYHTQGICPEGWHIPTIDDWQTLLHYLAPDEGAKLKDTTSLWMSPNNATNESGFSALPGGSLSYHPEINEKLDFNSKGYDAFIWQASTNYERNQGNYKLLDWDFSTVYGGGMYFNYANSVRCIKDQ